MTLADPAGLPRPPMGPLLACLGHELNNQLAILSGRSELMELDVAPDSQLAADIKVIRDATMRSARSVRSLLELVVPRPGSLVTMPLADLLDCALDVLARPLSNRGIVVDLQGVDRAVQVHGVRTDMDQAVLFAVFYAMLALDAAPAAQRRLGIRTATHHAARAGDGDTVSVVMGVQESEAVWNVVPSLSDGVHMVHAALARHGGCFSVEADCAGAGLRMTLPAAATSHLPPARTAI